MRAILLESLTKLAATSIKRNQNVCYGYVQNIKLPLNHLPLPLITSARLWLIKGIYAGQSCGLMLPQYSGITYFLTFFSPCN